MKRLLTLALVFAAACASAGAQTRNAAAQDTLIRNATVLTVSHGTLTGTDVLIRGGKIAAVGQNLKAPDGAAILDDSEASVVSVVAPTVEAEPEAEEAEEGEAAEGAEAAAPEGAGEDEDRSEG